MAVNVDFTTMYLDMEGSKLYANYRTRYSDELFKTIVDYCKETNPNLELAVDVGCGPGMSTIGFGKYFKKVIGVDVSETQIACAPKDIPNMEFRVGYSDNLPFVETGSADLYSVGMAFHYFSRKETFSEADRILKPGGTLALFGHGLIGSTNPQVDAAIQEIYKHLIPLWPEGTTEDILEGFKNVHLPYLDCVRRNDLQMITNTTFDDLLGFIRSFYPYRVMCEKFPERHFDKYVCDRLREALQKPRDLDGDHMTFELVFNFFILMGHKPKQQ